MRDFYSTSESSVRLKKLCIKNFLSIKEACIELGKLNVLIGPNASGKSNVLKALRLLRNHVTVGLPTPDEDSPNEIPFGDLVHSFNIYETIEVKTTLELKGEEASYELRLLKDRYEEVIKKGGEVLYECSGKVSTARYRSRDGVIKEVGLGISKDVTVVLRSPEGGVKKVLLSLYASPLTIPPIDVDESIHVIIEFLRRVGVFGFNPASVRLSSNVSAEPVVKYSGANLARYLLHLYLERRRDFTRVEDVVRGLVPEVEEVIPHIEGNVVEVWLKSRDLTLPLRPGGISDGTIRLLAIAFILNAGFNVVAVEEPENHVHPNLLEALVDLARKAPSQVIFTTQSPHLLDYVNPEEVFIVGKVGSETKVKKLIEGSEAEVVRKFLKEGGTLGEAWYSRFFGDVE